jgi:hypothetical protein
MNSTIVVAIITGIFSTVNVLMPVILAKKQPIDLVALKLAIIAEIIIVVMILIVFYFWRKRKVAKGELIGSINQLLVPSRESNMPETLRKYLSEANEIRLCGRSLADTIKTNKVDLRDFVQRGGILKILLLDSASPTVDELDSVLSDGDAIERKRNNFIPPVVSTHITRHQLSNNITILQQNNLLELNGVGESQTLHLCKTLLPFSMIMLEKRDGAGWASISLYPLHPDIPAPKRQTFALSDNSSPLWQNLKQQFDLAWEDPSLSKPFS